LLQWDTLDPLPILSKTAKGGHYYLRKAYRFTENRRNVTVFAYTNQQRHIQVKTAVE